MTILWLEDRPQTIFTDFVQPLKKMKIKVIISQSYDDFCDAMFDIEDKSKLLIVLDIRMMLKTGIDNECFGQSYTIKERLTGGFEFYVQCLKSKFKDVPVFFLTSKPNVFLEEEKERFEISKKIFTKGGYVKFLDAVTKLEKKMKL